MTYTFKLARRLAVSRDFAMLAALAILAGCMDEPATAPDVAESRFARAAFLSVYPRVVTAETNQPVRFRGIARDRHGDTIPAPFAWTSTGGSMQADGTFSSSTAGTFKVVGRRRGWKKQADTSVVIVVPPTLNVVRLTVSPESTSLTPGATRTFTATGYLSDGTATVVGVNWTATGGAIDASGAYTAGPSAGSYRVIAVNTAGTLADTAAVTISLPAPTLASVYLTPTSVTLSTGAAQQFKAYGRNSVGDSVAVSVSFSATGGTVTSGGLYTAGSTSGSYRVIATAGGLADSSTVTVTAPEPAPSGAAKPFGPFDLFQTWTAPTVPGFSGTVSYASPSGIVTLLNSMRNAKVRGFLKMTGDPHSTYITNGAFDISKWKAATAAYNTSTIRNAIAAAVADGTLLGYSMIDEPNHSDWGGVITKATLDEMATYSKSLFPTLPAGAVVPYTWRSTERYRVVDFIISQTWKPTLTPVQFRDAAIEAAKLNGVALAFSVNILGGPTIAGCELYGTTCIMTPSQIRDWGTTLGSAASACSLVMWKYYSPLWGRADYLEAFKVVAAAVSTGPASGCRRP